MSFTGHIVRHSRLILFDRLGCRSRRLWFMFSCVSVVLNKKRFITNIVSLSAFTLLIIKKNACFTIDAVNRGWARMRGGGWRWTRWEGRGCRSKHRRAVVARLGACVGHVRNLPRVSVPTIHQRFVGIGCEWGHSRRLELWSLPCTFSSNQFAHERFGSFLRGC